MPLRPALAIAALLLASCTTARMHRPEVELRLDAPAAAPGDTVSLVATLRNATPDTLAMEFATACWLAFHVRAADGRALHESRAGEPCGTAPLRIVLAPGEERRAEARYAAGETAGAAPPTAYLILDEHYLERGGRRVFKAGHRFGETTLPVARR